MAEERRLTSLVDEEEPQPEEPKTQKKKRKKIGKLATFFWLLLLGIGVGAGLHLSGLWDGRPLFWTVIPKIPYVGKDLAEFFRVPEIYSLTTSERRAIELTDWQKRLDERERALTNRRSELDILSEDLEVKQGDIERREELLAQSGEENAGSGPTPTEQELMNQVARTYQDMSARNAAAIVEQLRDSLAVELLMKLPNDARSSILGKMKPTRAARLTELMTRPNR